MTFGITDVDHVQIAVPRALEKECQDFYRRVLGLAEIAKPEELRSRGGAWFQLANLQLHIGLDPEMSPASKRHICLLVNDVGEARATAQVQRLAIEEEKHDPEGSRRFFIRDPAGNRLEIAQR